MHNSFKRKTLALLAVLLLSVPSAIGVQHALAPTRGQVASWMGAAGFEAVYLSTAILILSTDLRRYAQRIALAAVITAVVLNTIADYAARNPLGLASAGAAWAHFDGLALALSLVESLPLAGLSYAMASLLHRLAEQEGQPTEAAAQLDQVAGAPALPALRPALAHSAEQPTAEYATARLEAPVSGAELQDARVYRCKRCAHTSASLSAAGQHARACKRQTLIER